MTMTPEDKKFTTQRIALVGLGVFVLSGSLVGAFLLGNSAKAIRGLFSNINNVLSDSGDTPVVLVGGSLKFIAGASSFPWMQDSPTAFHVSPNYAVKTIAIKAKGVDGDPTTDLLRADVSNATSWEVDEFITTQPGAPDLKVATITSVGYQINLTALNGYLCPGGTTVSYGQQAGCVDVFTVSRVSLTVTDSAGSVELGSINCVDPSSTSQRKGKCRIIFRAY